jgi:hypothetical protein
MGLFLFLGGIDKPVSLIVFLNPYRLKIVLGLDEFKNHMNM